MIEVDDLIKRYPTLADSRAAIELAVSKLCGTIASGGTILLCGNGGSAADAEHIAGELMKSFIKPRPLNENLKRNLVRIGGELGAALAATLQTPIRALPLTGMPALSTAFANDADPYFVFAQQALAFADANSTLIGISTSGNSKNVIAACIAAKARGSFTIGLTGQSGGKMKDICDLTITVPETETYKIQELHLPIYHAICIAVENYFVGLIMNSKISEAPTMKNSL